MSKNRSGVGSRIEGAPALEGLDLPLIPVAALAGRAHPGSGYAPRPSLNWHSTGNSVDLRCQPNRDYSIIYVDAVRSHKRLSVR